MRAIPMAVSNGALTVAALLLLAASSVAAYSGEGAEGTRKVDVALYYESLCPYSAQFVVDRLAKVFDNGLLDAVDLTLVPYGNARVGPGGKISCQVGSPRARSAPLGSNFLALPGLCVNLIRNSLGSRCLLVLDLNTNGTVFTCSTAVVVVILILVELFVGLLQHGPYECLLNTVEACAIDAWPDLVIFLTSCTCTLFISSSSVRCPARTSAIISE
uniref:Uncharacterized protein n=1 Tax=Arundo donax TaxID=35708 RepID=A0A0A9DM87_ARUDO